MELIKLPMQIGISVMKILKDKGYEPRKNSVGLLSLEFTQEELNNVTEIEFINPTANCLDGIELLQNLQTLKISTTGETAYRNDCASICDKDIKSISKITSLKSLTLNNQSNISWVYLDKLINLETLNITRNSKVEEISGLDKLKKIKELSAYGNKNLSQLMGIKSLINDNELDILELDLLNYPEIEPVKNKLMNMPNCNFNEVLVGKEIISYTCGQASLLHQKCLKIIENIKKLAIDKRMRIICIEKYLAENIFYDSEGKNSENRALTVNGIQRGKNYGTNSAYNGIMFGSCVCEGYTRSMQYLLKILGIKTENVYCISGANKVSVNTSYHNMVSLPNDGYHSIIRIDDEDMLYCDPCWDSCRWHRGDKTLSYCLLTKDEISRDHTLSFEENIVANNHLKLSREYIKYALQSLNSLEDNNLDESKLDINHRR